MVVVFDARPARPQLRRQAGRPGLGGAARPGRARRGGCCRGRGGQRADDMQRCWASLTSAVGAAAVRWPRGRRSPRLSNASAQQAGAQPGCWACRRPSGAPDAPGDWWTVGRGAAQARVQVVQALGLLAQTLAGVTQASGQAVRRSCSPAPGGARLSARRRLRLSRRRCRSAQSGPATRRQPTASAAVGEVAIDASVSGPRR